MFYAKFPKPEVQHLQSDDPDGLSFNFWDDIYSLALRGRLTDAWELLQLHSEIRTIIEYTSSAEDRKGLADLREIFASHPVHRLDGFLSSYRNILESIESKRKSTPPFSSVLDGLSPEDENTISEFIMSYSSEWMRWHSLTSSVRKDPYRCPLVARMPHLQTVLNIMMGDVSTLGSLCSKTSSDLVSSSLCWQQYALCLLIYSGHTPPPFSKTIVVQQLEEAMRFQSSMENSHGEDLIPRLLQKVIFLLSI